MEVGFESLLLVAGVHTLSATSLSIEWKFSIFTLLAIIIIVVNSNVLLTIKSI